MFVQPGLKDDFAGAMNLATGEAHRVLVLTICGPQGLLN